MSGRDLAGTDPAGAAWDAFVREDRALLAPPRLESRVQQEVQRRLTASVSRGHRRTARAGWRRHRTMTAAAALCLTCAGAGLGYWLALPARTAVPAQGLALAERATRGATLASVENAPTPRRHGRTPLPRTVRTRARSAEPPVTVAVAVVAEPDQTWDTLEPSRLVRVRVPPSSLAAFGVRVDGASPLVDDGTLVDVDLVVGVDGWPRDILRVRAADGGVFQAQVEDR